MTHKVEKSPKPRIYEKGTRPFWTVPYISKKMLEVHLNPETEKASRKPEFMDRSVQWINSLIPSNSKVLDLGCGPGLYLSRLAKLGHSCTGIDFSENSIAHAKEHFSEGGAQYICGDYIDTEFGSEYDLVILVYCDFGVLSFEEQSTLLSKISTALKPGGLFILDVFTKLYFDNFEIEFEVTEADGGFWNPGPHRLIKETYKYEEELVVLGQYQLITEMDRELFRIWSKCYRENEIIKMVSSHGLEIVSLHDDICGNMQSENSETIGIVCQKG